ncbi:hypothetical protein B0H10DRAFT_1957666 [Mycena sp. CBHHK59/15]|nr:hypothetical protein B0H10DRAFT_1957666 [Mycena sp. CBHHK59/15]
MALKALNLDVPVHTLAGPLAAMGTHLVNLPGSQLIALVRLSDSDTPPTTYSRPDLWMQPDFGLQGSLPSFQYDAAELFQFDMAELNALFASDLSIFTGVDPFPFGGFDNHSSGNGNVSMDHTNSFLQ